MDEDLTALPLQLLQLRAGGGLQDQVRLRPFQPLVGASAGSLPVDGHPLSGRGCSPALFGGELGRCAGQPWVLQAGDRTAQAGFDETLDQFGIDPGFSRSDFDPHRGPVAAM